MKYTQQNRQYGIGVLTDAPQSIDLPPDAIVTMTFDRETNCYVASRPSKIIYPKARELLKQYRREYDKALEELETS